MGNEIANIGGDIAKRSVEGIGKYASTNSKKTAANAALKGGIGAAIGLGLGALISVIVDSVNSSK